MIFILDIILAINLYLAIRYFKSIVSPPCLMGIGMFLASIIATFYYQEWSMSKFSDHAVFLLGGGCLFFTLCCISLRKINNNMVVRFNEINFNKWNLELLFKILLVFDILYIFHIYNIYNQMQEKFQAKRRERRLDVSGRL